MPPRTASKDEKSPLLHPEGSGLTERVQYKKSHDLGFIDCIRKSGDGWLVPQWPKLMNFRAFVKGNCKDGWNTEHTSYPPGRDQELR